MKSIKKPFQISNFQSSKMIFLPNRTLIKNLTAIKQDNSKEFQNPVLVWEESIKWLRNHDPCNIHGFRGLLHLISRYQSKIGPNFSIFSSRKINFESDPRVSSDLIEF